MDLGATKRKRQKARVKIFLVLKSEWEKVPSRFACSAPNKETLTVIPKEISAKGFIQIERSRDDGIAIHWEYREELPRRKRPESLTETFLRACSSLAIHQVWVGSIPTMRPASLNLCNCLWHCLKNHTMALIS